MVAMETLFQGLDRLDMLFMAGNKLSTLRKGSFQDLDAAIDLRLAWNRLPSLPAANISGRLANGSRRSLFLDLGQNNFSALPEGLFYGLELSQLILEGNRL